MSQKNVLIISSGYDSGSYLLGFFFFFLHPASEDGHDEVSGTEIVG